MSVSPFSAEWISWTSSEDCYVSEPIRKCEASSESCSFIIKMLICFVWDVLLRSLIYQNYDVLVSHVGMFKRTILSHQQIKWMLAYEWWNLNVTRTKWCLPCLIYVKTYSPNGLCWLFSLCLRLLLYRMSFYTLSFIIFGNNDIEIYARNWIKYDPMSNSQLQLLLWLLMALWTCH